MKKVFFTVLIIIVILMGCQGSVEEPSDTGENTEPQQAIVVDTPEPTQETIVAEPEPVSEPSAPTPAPAVETPPAPPAVEPEPPVVETKAPIKVTDSKLQSLLEKQEKVNSYSFYYSTSENWNLIRDQYLIKGDIVKVKLFEVNQWDKDYFDSVYLNMKTKTAKAFCENRDQDRCKDKDREFAVNYEDFIIVTPLEWLNSITPDAEIVSSESFDERMSAVVEYKRDDGTMVRIWVDKFAGIPVRILVYMDEVENVLEQYSFRDLTINTLTRKDMEHQFDEFNAP